MVPVSHLHPRLRSNLQNAVVGLLALAAAMGMSGCVYFNTYYNAQKAYDQAARLHEKRIDKNPEDSVLVSPEEKIKLDRCITKSSKVLELFPEKKKYQPKALFLIGESYMALGEYSKAILKYEELARFYPGAKEIPTADFHHAKCLFLNGQYLVARPALEKVMNTSSNEDFRREAMEYLAKLELQNNSPIAALELYEKLIREQAKTPEARANAHFEAAKLAFGLKLWDRARGHAVDKDIKELPNKLQYRCQMLAAECLYRLGRVQEGIDELQAMKKNRLYYSLVPEIDLQLAQGWFLINQPVKAVELLTGVPKLAPKTAYSAEAFYRLGDHELRDLKNEKQAKVYFDSATAAGAAFEYAILAAERSAALGRLAELRKPADSTAKESHYRDFMIAELFLFRLETVDSALGHLDRIVQDPRQDSSHSMRAAYARAFIQEEFKQSKPVSDSLYRFVLEKYPNTEYAKQAERNLGMKPTVQTDEDMAHKQFLDAEASRFGGGELRGTVIPAYSKVIADHGGTREAAKAQFVIAMLYEQMAHGEERVAGSLDSAISAYQVVRERYPQTPYGAVAETKLAAANIKPRSKSAPATAPVPTAPASASSAPGSTTPSAVSHGTPLTPTVPGAAKPAQGAPPAAAVPAGTPAALNPGTPAAVPATPVSGDDYRGGHGSEVQPPTPDSASTPDTAATVPEGKTKEVLDNDYENVDQY
ncbi:MAG: tetratricopeptide repeat protein [Fibrobacteria bacterium]